MLLRDPCCALIALSCVAHIASADESAMELPAEGAWVRYHGVTKPDNEPEVTYKLTIRFLGRETHQGRLCRWIETEETYDDARQGMEILVPEVALQNSERPLDETIKCRYRNREGEVVSESLERVGFTGTDFLFLPAARKSAKVVDEPQIVDYQSGRLTIPLGWKGEYVWSREAKTIKQTQTMKWDYTIWIDPKVPLGVARKKMTLSRQIDGMTTKTYTQDQYLEDFGLDAKSAFR